MELLDLDPWVLEHPLGRDVTTATPAEAGPSRAEQDSDRYLPGPTLHALARMEAKAISLTR